MQTFGNDGREELRPGNDTDELARACPACGTDMHRGEAQFCLTCGRKLETEVYLPADSLRASYHWQQHRQGQLHHQEAAKPRQRAALPKVATPNRNGASSTALAFATYALVPYLGILFCPGAVLMGSVGLIRQWRVPQLGGRNASYAGVVFGVMIFSAQVFLWWILYKVPQWATGVEF
jgi:hypothetical protein